MLPFGIYYSSGYYPQQPNLHFIDSTKPHDLRCKKEEQFTETSLTMDARIYTTSSDYPDPQLNFTSLFTKHTTTLISQSPIPNPYTPQTQYPPFIRFDFLKAHTLIHTSARYRHH